MRQTCRNLPFASVPAATQSRKCWIRWVWLRKDLVFPININANVAYTSFLICYAFPGLTNPTVSWIKSRISGSILSTIKEMASSASAEPIFAMMEWAIKYSGPVYW